MHEIDLLPTRLSYLSELAEELLNEGEKQGSSDFSFNNNKLVGECVDSCRSRANNVLQNAQILLEKANTINDMNDQLQVTSNYILRLNFKIYIDFH